MSEAGFTKILCNPPYHADFGVAKRLVQKGFNRLVLDGSMWMDHAAAGVVSQQAARDLRKREGASRATVHRVSSDKTLGVLEQPPMIDVESADSIAVIRLAHGRANVLDTELCRALTRTLASYGDDSRTRAIVLTGAGSIFSAGVDLKRVLDGGAAYVATFLPALCDVFETLFALRKPVVAAVNGHAIAGGCVLVCAADHRVMATGSGRIGVPELLVGVPFPSIALEIMRSAVAPPHLTSAVYGGATNEPARALAIGLVDELVTSDELLPCAIDHARRLAALPSHAFAATKRQLREPLIRRAHGELARLDETVQQLWEAPESMARIRAYVERTLKRR